MSALYSPKTKHLRRTMLITANLRHIPLITAVVLLSLVFVRAPFTHLEASAVSNAARLLERKSLSARFIKNSAGKRLEFGSLSGYKKKGYSVFQGACSDGEYSYHVLYNKKNDRCRIIKVDPSSWKIVKISRSYKLYHGNDMTYDSKRSRIVVVHGDGDTKRISVFDPSTLKRRKVVKLRFNKAFRGAGRKTARKLKGVTGIAYDEKHDRFIASIKSTFHYVVLTPKFKPVKLIRTGTRSKKLQKQGMDIVGGHIMRVMNKYTKKSIRNYIYLYNMRGKLVRRIKIKTTSEVESTYFLGGRLYAPTYIEKGKGKKFRNWSHLLILRGR